MASMNYERANRQDRQREASRTKQRMPKTKLWIVAKFPGKCYSCEHQFSAGDRVLFAIATKKCYCKKCSAGEPG